MIFGEGREEGGRDNSDKENCKSCVCVVVGRRFRSQYLARVGVVNDIHFAEP
jgi:hypothetical protein